jgi:hypothetical protein
MSVSAPLLRNERKCLEHPLKFESDPLRKSRSLAQAEPRRQPGKAGAFLVAPRGNVIRWVQKRPEILIIPAVPLPDPFAGLN